MWVKVTTPLCLNTLKYIFKVKQVELEQIRARTIAFSSPMFRRYYTVITLHKICYLYAPQRAEQHTTLCYPIAKA